MPAPSARRERAWVGDGLGDPHRGRRRRARPARLVMSLFAPPFPPSYDASSFPENLAVLGGVPCLVLPCEAGASYTAAAAGGSRLAPIVERLRAIAEAAASPEA